MKPPTKPPVALAFLSLALTAWGAWGAWGSPQDAPAQDDPSQRAVTPPVDEPAQPRWPETPAGDAARQFHALLNGGPPPAVREPDDSVMGPPAPGTPSPGDLRFTPNAEARVPISQITEFMDARRASFGTLELHAVKTVAVDRVAVLLQASGDGSGWLLEVWTEPEWPHRITQWQFVPSPEAARVPEFSSWADLGAAFDRFATDHSLTYALAVREQPPGTAGPGTSQTLTRLGSDARLNIGAMVRYVVLDAMAAAVNEGAVSWEAPMTIAETAHSMPPSQASQVPPGQEVPTLAVLQAAILARDNTAVDALIELVGRERVAAALTSRTGDDPRNAPFLDTMDAMRLKIGAQGDVVERFLQADEPTQAAMLDAEVAGNAVPEAFLSTWRVPQHASTIGWFATAEDFASLLADLWAMQGPDSANPVVASLFANAPLPAQGEAWQAAGFRAGAGEPGVLAAYWLLRRDDGRSFIVTLLLNDEDAAIPFEALQPILLGMVDYLAGLERKPAGSGEADDAPTADGAGDE